MANKLVNFTHNVICIYYDQKQKIRFKAEVDAGTNVYNASLSTECSQKF